MAHVAAVSWTERALKQCRLPHPPNRVATAIRRSALTPLANGETNDKKSRKVGLGERGFASRDTQVMREAGEVPVCLSYQFSVPDHPKRQRTAIALCVRRREHIDRRG